MPPTLLPLSPHVLPLSHVTEKGLGSSVIYTETQASQAELRHKGSLLCFTLMGN